MTDIEDSLPTAVAITHASYVRKTRIYLAHKAGAKFVQIGRVLGISGHRVSQLNEGGKRWAKYNPGLLPIERYFTKPVYSDWEKTKLRQYIGEFIHALDRSQGRDWLNVGTGSSRKRGRITVRWES